MIFCNQSEMFFTFAKENEISLRSRRQIEIFTSAKENEIFLHSGTKVKFLQTVEFARERYEKVDFAVDM